MYKNMMIVVLAGALALSLWWRPEAQQPTAPNVPAVERQEQANSKQLQQDHAAIETAFREKRRNVWVEGSGKVIAVLSDDNKGSRHQRFILKLDNGISLLFAHNIDLAPRLPELRKGDEVSFRGEYIYNTKGGIIHWTHHDPQRRHQGGWLQYHGKRYQ